MAWRQYQFGPEHTGRSPVFQYPQPQGYAPGFINFTPPDDKTTLQILTHPVVYDGQIIVVVKSKPTGADNGDNSLYCLSHAGSILWKQPLPHNHVPPENQKQPAVSLDGRFYQSWKPYGNPKLESIVGYDLKQRGKEIRRIEASKIDGNVTDITELTVGNDGSLFFAAVVENARGSLV